MYRLLLLLSLALSQSVWGGGVNSGGGYVVACKENEVTKYQFLDFFEAEQKTKKMVYIDIPASADEYETASAAIERIRRFSPALASEWQQTVQDFKFSEMTFVKNAKIKDIDDAEMIIDDIENCEVLQAAVQVKEPARNEFRLFVSEALWKGMDTKTRAGLLVHEAIYKTAMQQGHTKSVDFRRITALLFNKELDHMSDIQLANFFNVAHINGCFVKSFDYYDVIDGAPISNFQMQLEIKSFKNYKESKQFVGEACENGNIHNIFGQGRLAYIKGNKIGGGGGQFCVEDTKEQADVLRFYRMINGEVVSTLEEIVCFSVYDPQRITYTKRSPHVPTHLWPSALEFEECNGQYFEKGEIVQCDLTVAAIITADKQVIELEKMRYDSQTNMDFYDVKQSSQQITVAGNTIKISPRLLVNKNLEILLSVLKNHKVQINGVSCTINTVDHIVLDQFGAFKTIVSKYEHQGYAPGSCVELLNQK